MGLTLATTTSRRERTPQRISLCLMVGDEDEHPARCLRSVEGVVDEVVIVNTGSVETSVEMADGEWILVLDAGEELIGGPALRELLHDEEVAGYHLRIVDLVGEELGIGSAVSSALRLFRNRPPRRDEGALRERFVGIEIHRHRHPEPTPRAREGADRAPAIALGEMAREPSDSLALFDAGVECQRVGRYEEALTHYRRAFASLPSLRAHHGSLLLRNIAATLGAMSRDDEALAVLEDARVAYPEFTDLHHLAGRIHASRREYRAAMRSLCRAIELGDRRDRHAAPAGMGPSPSWHALGGLHALMGERHEAVRCFRRAVATAPDFAATPLARLAAALLEGDEPDTVRDHLLGVLPEAHRADGLRVLGEVLAAEGHPARAVACLEEARALRPGDDAHAPALADAHVRLGDHERARVELARVAAGSPAHAAACRARVLVGIVSGDLGAAAEAADELGAIDGGLYTIAYRSAVAALADAETPLVPAGTDRVRLVAVVLELCDTLLGLGGLARFDALVPLLYALADGPAQVDEPLGRILYAHDLPEPAADRLLAAATRGDASPEAYAGLGHICRRRGAPEEARAFFAEALARDDDNATRYLDLAELHASERDDARAGEVLRRGLAVHPDSTALRALGQTVGTLADIPS